MSTVRTNIVRIGNSQGIRIPKTVLEQAQLSSDVEIEVQGNQLVIRSARHVREGWDEAFRAMAEAGDDRLPDWDQVPLTTWDDEAWEWE